ncbi:SIR2 family protein [Pseudomonas sp. P105]|uniref:SIR2 family protein n=1 Tax=Pseudomonas sp. P105 TaxID=3049542 RepID=UPI002934A666|nr:SIR2 family protein [Pseudomonas sp. P105]WNZ80333.1 SIR2 family protein [Pseudomonas sp. P105]
MPLPSPSQGSDDPVDRVISLGDDLPSIPERLLLAHARGEVLFIAGAGVSMPANLPDFRRLVINVYERLDGAVHTIIANHNNDSAPDDLHTLSYQQAAEVKRFIARDYDIVLGMLERRMDRLPGSSSQVRKTIVEILREGGNKPAKIHRALMRLADRGGVITIATTNFDLLLQAAVSSKTKIRPPTYALGAIPRPGRSKDFSGVLHIHGALEKDFNKLSDLIVTDHDFGEFYLRRRTVPDFIYDAARLYHLVLIGYSANDPPMRYLLNAVAADGVRFDDLKERFTFVGLEESDPIADEDWKGRGITPISYNSEKYHIVLLKTLDRWASLSAINGNKNKIDSEIRRIVKKTRNSATDSDRDIFDHFFRRSNNSERTRLASFAAKCRADNGWLDAIIAVCAEKNRGGAS